MRIKSGAGCGLLVRRNFWLQWLMGCGMGKPMGCGMVFLSDPRLSQTPNGRAPTREGSGAGRLSAFSGIPPGCGGCAGLRFCLGIRSGGCGRNARATWCGHFARIPANAAALIHDRRATRENRGRRDHEEGCDPHQKNAGQRSSVSSVSSVPLWFAMPACDCEKAAVFQRRPFLMRQSIRYFR
jgi:hypothetical protein